MASEPPKIPEPILIIIEKMQEVEPEPKIYTIEEKIEQNYYNCDETVEYISAENATCLPKPQNTQNSINTQLSDKNTSEPIKNASGLTTAPAGWYSPGQCTHYVWSQRPVGRWGNASQWYYQAQLDGWSTGVTPQAGAIGVQKRGNHVVLVERVDGDRIYISERNYDYRGSYRERWVSSSDYRYIY